MSSLRDCLSSAGFNTSRLPVHLTIGKFYRIPAPGKGKGNKSGWVKLHDQGIASYGSWADGSTHTWKADDGEHQPDRYDPEKRRQREAQQAKEEAQKSEWAAGKIARIWAQAKPAGDHPYLARKKIAAHGLRVHNGRLVIPVRDALTGELISLQYIAADGSKLFEFGGRVGNGCHIIPGTLPRIFCEGYATGATLHAATGREVVVCFSASNIPPVAKAIGKPGDVVAADNDNGVKDKDRLKFDKAVAGYGTGHKAAIEAGLPFYMPHQPGADFNEMAVEQVAAMFAAKPLTDLPVFDAWKLKAVALKGTRREQWLKQLAAATGPRMAADLAWSVASRMSSNAPAQTSLQGIRQAIEAASTPGTLHPATLDGIMERLNRALEYRRGRALEAVSIPHEIQARHTVLKAKTLPVLTEADYRGVIVLWMPMASGKTKGIGKPAIKYARDFGLNALAICHRVTLVEFMAGTLDTAHYQYVDDEMAQRIDAMTTCLPSITLSRHKPFIDSARFVFIDEVSQVLRFLASSSHCKTSEANNEKVYDRLREIVAKAECVIVADAGVDRRTIEFLEECRPGEKFKILHMAPKQEGISAKYFTGSDSPGDVLRACMGELESGGKVWIACESKEKTKILGEAFRNDGYKVMAVHHDNHDEEGPAAFLANVEAESRNYDVVIASPLIGSGVSVEHRNSQGVTEKHFTLGAFIGGGHAISPADAAQMLRRVRYIPEFVIGLVPNTKSGRQAAEGVLTGKREAAKLERTIAVENGFSRLVAGIEADEDNHKSDFTAGLLWQLRAANWELTRGEKIADEGDSDALEAATAQVRAQRRAALMTAPVLTHEEAKRMEELPARTMIQNEWLDAHRIRQALGVTMLDDATLDFWDDGRVLRIIDRFSAFQGTVSAFNDREENIANRKFNRATASAYAKLLAGTGLTPENAREARITDEVAATIMDRATGPRRFALAQLGIVPKKYGAWIVGKDGKLKRPEPKNPRQELAEILALMGLAWKRREGSSTPTLQQNGLCNSGEGGGKSARPRFYQVTPESIAQMAMWADRRNAARLVEHVAGPEPTAEKQVEAPAPVPVVPRRRAQILLYIPSGEDDWFLAPKPAMVPISAALISQALAAQAAAAEWRPPM